MFSTCSTRFYPYPYPTAACLVIIERGRVSFYQPERTPHAQQGLDPLLQHTGPSTATQWWYMWPPDGAMGQGTWDAGVLRAALCSVFWGVTAAGFFAPAWLREVRAADRSNAMVSMEAFGA